MEEIFERPFVEKYRPETLDEVVGNNYLLLFSLLLIGNKFAVE
jgi:replication-associated recombination protein RarA